MQTANLVSSISENNHTGTAFTAEQIIKYLVTLLTTDKINLLVY